MRSVRSHSSLSTSFPDSKVTSLDEHGFSTIALAVQCSGPLPTPTDKEYSMKDSTARDRFDAAVKQNQARIDALPHGPERDAYVEGLADGCAID